MLKNEMPATIWVARSLGRWIECAARLVPIGVQVEIVSDGWPIYSRIFPTGDEAILFAEEERAVWTTPQD